MSSGRRWNCLKEELESLTPEQKKELQALLKKSSPPEKKSGGRSRKQDGGTEAGKPTWFREHKIIEIPFCEEFLKSHPIVCVHGQLYDCDGRVDEEQLKQEMMSVIRPYVGVNVARKLDQLVKAMKTVALIREFPVQTDRVHVRNGTLFLNGEFRVEKEFCVYRLSVSYNPAAAPPKTWLAFLNELLFEEDIRAFQEFLGYIFLPTNKGQVMMLLIGKGGEGKSRIGLVLHSLLGDSMNFGSIVKLATDRFNPADQEGKLLLFDDDMRTDALTDTGTLKSIITAEGKFDLERKGRQSFQGELFVRLLALSNGSLSALYDRSDAFYRRQLVIRVKERPEDRVDDPRIAEKMIAEKEGIFLWCLEGLKRLISQNYHFSVSDRMKENLKDVRESDDNIIEFYESEGYIRFEEGTMASTKKLYRAYQAWCDDNAERPLAEKTFSQHLKTDQKKLKIRYIKNLDIGGGKRVRGYRGVHVEINTDLIRSP